MSRIASTSTNADRLTGLPNTYIPVADVDHAKAFYVEQVGFHAVHDHQVNEALRFVQLTPPGSACSIVLGTEIVATQPGWLGVRELGHGAGRICRGGTGF